MGTESGDPVWLSNKTWYLDNWDIVVSSKGVFRQKLPPAKIGLTIDGLV